MDAISTVFLGLLALGVDLAIASALAAVVALVADTALFVPVLTLALALLLLVWQSTPFLLGSFETPFDLSRLRHFPVSVRELYAIDVVFGAVDPIVLLGAIPLAAIFLAAASADSVSAFEAAHAAVAFGLFNVALLRLVRRLAVRLFANRRRREAGAIVVLVLVLAVAGLLQLGASERIELVPEEVETPEQIVELLEPQVRATADALWWTPPGAAARAATGAPWLSFATGALAAGLLAVDYRRLAAEHETGAERAGAPAAPAPRAPGAGVPRLAEPEAPGRPSLLARLAGETVAAVFVKDLRYLLRSPFALQTTIGSLFATFLFALFVATDFTDPRFLSQRIAGLYFYTLLICSQLYSNTFGLDGHGAKLYFTAPAPIRRVLAGKNLAILVLIAVQMAIITVVMSLLAGPLGAGAIARALLVCAAGLPIMLGIGNLMSALRPRAINPKKIFEKRQPASVGLAIFGASIMVALFSAIGPFVGWLTGSVALEVGIVGAEIAVAVAVYVALLNRAVRTLEQNVDGFFDSLLKR